MREKLIRIYNVLNELYKEGYVPSGSIELVKPETPGLVDLEVQINDKAGFLRITTKAKSEPMAMTLQEIAKAQGFTGNTCSDCHLAMMVRQGTCEKCLNCGATSGCS